MSLSLSFFLSRSPSLSLSLSLSLALALALALALFTHTHTPQLIADDKGCNCVKHLHPGCPACTPQMHISGMYSYPTPYDL